MYANLEVSIAAKPVPVATTGHKRYSESVYAWSVEIADGKATIALDANNGEGNYAEPAGERVVDLSTHEIAIGADF